MDAENYPSTHTTHYRVYIDGVPKRTTDPARFVERTDGAIVLDAVAGVLYLCHRPIAFKRLGFEACMLLTHVMRRPRLSSGPNDWDDDEVTRKLKPGNYRAICCRLNKFFESNGYGKMLQEGDHRQHYLQGGYVRGRKLPNHLPYPVIVIEHEIASLSI